MKRTPYLNLSTTIFLFSLLFLPLTNGAQVLERLDLVTTQTHGYDVFSVAWCDGCNYLAIGGNRQTPGGSEIRVYRFDGSTLDTVTTQTYNYNDNMVHSVAWCNGCKYLATGEEQATMGESQIRVFSFDKTNSTLDEVTKKTYGSVQSIALCDGCNYLAIGEFSSPQIRILSFNKTNSTLNEVTTKTPGATVWSVAWCDGCDYLAIGGNTGTGGYEIRVYRFNGSTLNLVTSQTHGAIVSSVAWCNECDYLAIGGNTVDGGSQIRIYKSIFREPPEPPEIQSPSNLLACQELHRFPTQGDLINVVCWNSVVNAVKYNVYTDENLTQLLFTITQNETPFFCHHCRRPNCKDTYYIVAIDVNGNASTPTSITVP